MMVAGDALFGVDEIVAFLFGNRKIPPPRIPPYCEQRDANLQDRSERLRAQVNFAAMDKTAGGAGRNRPGGGQD